MQRAAALEHGDGVARDYQAAADVYRAACADGSGDLAACRRLLNFELEGRGVDVDHARAQALAAAICARDDLTGCLVTALSDNNPSQELIEKCRRLLELPCDAAHLARCEVPLEPFASTKRGSSRQAASREFAGRGCALGVIEACVDLRSAAGKEHDAAVVVLTGACRRGDATACDSIDQPLDAAPLCKAHDYNACMALGCAGDASAAEIARAHGVELECQGRKPYAVTRAASPGIVPKSQPVFDSVEFRRIGADTPGPVQYEVYNVGTRAINTMTAEVYAYDDAGGQIGRHHVELQQVRLAPGAGTPISLGTVAGATFEPCLRSIVFVDDTDHGHVTRCPLHKPRGVRWGNGSANVMLPVSLFDIPLADDWVGALEPSFCEPFEQSHAGVYVTSTAGSGGAVALAGAATDIALLTKELGGSVVELPAVLSPVSIAFNLPGAGRLRLSAPTLARIFAHAITQWDDKAIKRDNPAQALPSLPIVVIQETSRNDELVVTRYLARFAGGAWKLGETRDAPLHQAVEWQRPFEIGKKLAETPGAIAYVGPGVAAQAGLSVAEIQNPRGAFVAPTPSAIASGAYPLVSARSLYVSTNQPDRATADAARAYTSWLLGDGLAIFERLGYVRLPAAVTQAAVARLRTITAP
jgi:phosphate transport system substrate-binding protein